MSKYIDKLNSLNEDINTDNLIVPMDIEMEGTKINRIYLVSQFVLNIPEGVTSVGYIDWPLYSVMPGTGRYVTQISEIIFPASIENLNIIFSVQPRYKIKFTFKCDIISIFMNMSTNDELNYHRFTEEMYTKVLKAKEGKKEEIFKRWICSILGIPYTRAEFNFEIPLDFSRLQETEMDISDFN